MHYTYIHIDSNNNNSNTMMEQNKKIIEIKFLSKATQSRNVENAKMEL